MLTNRDLAPAGRGWAAADAAPNAVGAIDRRVRRLLQSGFGGAGGHRAEQELLRAVVEVVFSGSDDRRGRSTLPARTALTRRAEELMRSRLGGSLGAVDLCEALGVSDRTLRLAFRERYGSGPMAYYQAVRLNAARTALTAGTGRVSIEAVGRRFGFHYPGQFAVYYRRQFGESPSDTRAAAGSVRVGV